MRECPAAPDEGVVKTPHPRSSGRVLYHHLRVLTSVLSWWVTNGCTVLLNKWMFARESFRFPFSLTLVHLAWQSVLALLTVNGLRATSRVRFATRRDYTKVLLIATVFCLNITLGNYALREVPVSFFQVIKSATPAFTAALSWLVLRQRLTRAALIALVPVVAGVAMASATELSFRWSGFVAASLSCAMTALKFVLSAELLQGRYPFDPIQLIYYMAPPGALLLLPWALVGEGRDVLHWSQQAVQQGEWPRALGLLSLSGIGAFLLNVCMFTVLKQTSSVTLTVAGNLKVVLVIYASLLLFHNPVTAANMLGSLIAIAGCTWYGLLPQKYVREPTVLIK